MGTERVVMIQSETWAASWLATKIQRQTSCPEKYDTPIHETETSFGGASIIPYKTPMIMASTASDTSTPDRMQRQNTVNEDIEAQQLMPTYTDNTTAKATVRPISTKLFWIQAIVSITMAVALLVVVSLFFTGYITAAPSVSVRQDGSKTVIDIGKQICEPCTDFEEFVKRNRLPHLEETRFWEAIKRSSDGDTCCVDRFLPMLDSLTAFLLQSARDIADRNTGGNRSRFTGLHIVPDTRAASAASGEYVAISEWHTDDFDTSYLIGMTVSDTVRIPTSGLYTVTLKAAWRSSHEMADGATLADQEMFKAKITRPRRGSLQPGDEVLLEDREFGMTLSHDSHLPCASIILTANLQLAVGDRLTVSVSHPHRLLSNPYSYLDIVQLPQ